jgi:alpha-beta hydrolase superfamily lysophospholipase
MKEETIDVDSAKIFLRSWRPAAAPKAVVVLNHGFNSHSGQYVWAAEQLIAAGYAVYAHDMRGRGKSSGERFFVANPGDYVADVAAVIKLAKSRDPGLKVFLLGHSAGGVVATTYALDYQSELAGLICESFAFQVPAPEFALNTISALAGLLPRLKVLTLPNAAFSRDPKVVAALNSDPLIKDETQPAKTVAALWTADKRLKTSFPKITLPVLILHGTMDKATVPAGSQFFYDTAGSKDKTLKLYEGHFHDLLADIGKEGVMDDIKAWIAKHLA